MREPPQDAIGGMTAWLLSPDTRSLAAEELLAALADRLATNGVPVWRAVTSVPTKHPEVYVRNIRWVAGQGSEVFVRHHSLTATPMYTESPVAAIHGGTSMIRCRLAGAGADLRYNVCRALADQGGTDYVVWRLDLGDCEIAYISWATQREGGFTDEDLVTLEALNAPFALRLELEAANYTTRSLLEVYLGHNAALRVLAGAFRRGGGESIRAVIWFCDMRGFTSIADRMPASDVVETLDKFFEAVAGPIASYGGEILKFIGDAVLAIFPVEQQETERVCENAIAAATAASSLVDALNDARAPEAPIGFGIALHLGDVMYGNIGAQNRLDFTVIGAAVNEACRVEALSKSLGARLLMTRTFVDAWGGRAASAGTHTLRGVAVPQELFRLPRDEAG